MNEDEMKNRISLALKDPILQQGFEIICKENAILKGRTEGFEKQILGLLYKYESVYKRFPDLKDAMNKAERILKENKELKEELTKKADTNHSLVEQIAELEKENAELKKELVEKGQHLDLTEREWGKDTTKLIHYKTQLTNAKEIIKNLLSAYTTYADSFDDRDNEIVEEAEQFISEVEK